MGSEKQSSSTDTAEQIVMNKTLKLKDTKMRWGALEAMDALTQTGQTTCISFHSNDGSQAEKSEISSPQDSMTNPKEQFSISSLFSMAATTSENHQLRDFNVWMPQSL